MASETFSGPRIERSGPDDGTRYRAATRDRYDASPARRRSERGAVRVLSGAAIAVAIALTLGRALDVLGLPLWDVVPYFVVVIATAVLARRDWAGAAAVLALGPLLVSRSVLAPVTLSGIAPVAAAVPAVLVLIIHWRRVRVGWTALLVAGMGVLLVAPGIVGADQASLIKGVGVGAMWFALFVLAASTSGEQRSALAAGFVGAMTVEAMIAMTESFFRAGFVREYIAGGVGGGEYVVGPNLLIGDWATRSFGTIGHPIPLALLLVIAIVIVIGSWHAKRWPMRLVILLVLLGGVLATGARSALVSLLCAGLVLAVGAVRHLQRRRTLAIVSLGVVLAALAGGIGLILARSLASNDFSVEHRGGMLESAARLLTQPLDRVLFGFGYNAPVRLHALGILGNDGLNVVDNTLVTQAATAGIVGVVLLLVLLGAAAVRGGLIVRATLAAVLASMFFFDLQSWHLVMAIVWFAIAVGIYGLRTSRPPGGRGARRSLDPASGRSER